MKALDYRQFHPQEAQEIELAVRVLARREHTVKELDRLLTAIGSLRHTSQLYDGDKPLREEIGESLPDVVILEIEDSHQQTLDGIRLFVEAHGRQCEVFVTFPEADLQLVKLLLRCGVRDVLMQPVSQQDLGIALAGALARQGGASASASRKGGVIAFMSTRGNTGASLLAVNVAHQLATRFHKRTVLVDMDIQFGTVASELDLQPDQGLVDALRHPERIDKVFLESLTVRHPSGLAVLPSPGDPGAYEDLSADAVACLLTALSEIHDHVVVNLPIHLNAAVEQVFRLSHPLYLVTQDTLSTLRNLRMILQRLPQRGIPNSHLAVVHYRLDKKLKDVSDGDLLRLIGDIPLHVVRSDYRMAARAENEGRPVCELHAGSELARDIRDIAAEIAGASTPTPAKKGLRSLFS